jgi:DNA-binding MltR family transcriptional regulator
MGERDTNREALRKLSKRFPAPAEREKILGRLAKDSDISIALVGASLIEAGLEPLITSVFSVKDSRLVKEMYSSRGPLSDFNSKILLARALGIINSQTAEFLQSIRSIRNAFAHAKTFISFDHEVITKELTHFKPIKDLMAVFDSAAENEDSTPSMMYGNRTRFLVGVVVMLVVFESIKSRIDATERPHYQDQAIEFAKTEQV